MTLELRNALDRLETALVEADHPLAYSWARPPGRQADETQTAALELLGDHMPAEVVELWSWWGAPEFSPQSTLGHFDRQLPGGLTIDSLENAALSAQQRRDAELTNPECDRWLPTMYLDDYVTILWAEIDNADSDGRTPITVNYPEHYPDMAPLWRFSSIAELIDAMTSLLDGGHWVKDPTRSWHYPVASPKYGWLA